MYWNSKKKFLCTEHQAALPDARYERDHSPDNGQRERKPGPSVRRFYFLGQAEGREEQRPGSDENSHAGPALYHRIKETARQVRGNSA